MMEDQTHDLLDAEKKAYGKIIRMMAHEVNNSIGPINSILQSIMEFETPYTKEDGIEIKEHIDIAIQRNNKLNLFTKNFADIVRLPFINLKYQSLTPIISDIAKLMQGAFPNKDIKIVSNLPADPIFASIDQYQLEQVLINIIKNSGEAIDTNGTIEIIVQDNPPTIKVIDDGKGFEKEEQDKLFTPFYSSKQSGQGIGLTLSKEVLINHGADFSLTRKDLKTIFTIKFPEYTL